MCRSSSKCSGGLVTPESLSHHSLSTGNRLNKLTTINQGLENGKRPHEFARSLEVEKLRPSTAQSIEPLQLVMTSGASVLLMGPRRPHDSQQPLRGHIPRPRRRLGPAL